MTSFIVLWLICGIITLLIGRKKNIHPFGSFVLGAVLGLIGIVIILLSADRTAQGPEGNDRRQVLAM